MVGTCDRYLPLQMCYPDLWRPVPFRNSDLWVTWPVGFPRINPQVLVDDPDSCSPLIPSETGFLLPTLIHSLSFHSWWRRLSGVAMMIWFWGVIGLSKYPVCKTIYKWEIVKIHLAMEWHPSHEYFWECLHHLYLTYRIKKRCTNDIESSRKSDIQWKAHQESLNCIIVTCHGTW